MKETIEPQQALSLDLINHIGLTIDQAIKTLANDQYHDVRRLKDHFPKENRAYQAA